jgi:peptidyl-tRNA hydrolase, PTH1 family
MKMIYGLGNPGTRYEQTRHNVGFMVVDHLSQKWNIPVKKNKADALFGIGTISKVQVMLVKPQTFMNLSGYPLGALGAVAGEDLIVIHDDMDIPLGQVRIKTNGGTGGHKGLISIISEFGTNQFIRIRFGIGRPPENWDPSDYVLGRFTKEEKDAVQEQIIAAASAVEQCIKGEVTKAMNLFNKREKNNSSTEES